MTKEDALMKVLKERDEEDKIHYSKVYEIVNEIFDDFENRICRNCKYLIRTKKGLLCSHPINYDYIITDESFGCNKFERKESETQYNSD